MWGCHLVGSLIIHSVSISETDCKGYDIIYNTGAYSIMYRLIQFKLTWLNVLTLTCTVHSNLSCSAFITDTYFPVS